MKSKFFVLVFLSVLTSGSSFGAGFNKPVVPVKGAITASSNAVVDLATKTPVSQTAYNKVILKIGELEAKATSLMFEVYKLRKQVRFIDDDLEIKKILSTADNAALEKLLDEIAIKVAEESGTVTTDTSTKQKISVSNVTDLSKTNSSIDVKNSMLKEYQSLADSIRIKLKTADDLLKATEDSLDAEYRKIFPYFATAERSSASDDMKVSSMAVVPNSTASMIGGEVFLSKPDYYRATLLFFQTQFRRYMGRPMRTEIANLRQDADCSGEVVADQNMARYGLSLIEFDYKAALSELHKLSQQTECLSVNQLAFVDWSVTRAIFRTMQVLPKAKQKEFVMLVTNPALIIFDVRKPFFSPLLAFFKKYNNIIADVYTPQNTERFTDYAGYQQWLGDGSKIKAKSNQFDDTVLSQMGIFLVNRATGKLQFADFAKEDSGRDGSEYFYIKDVPMDVSALFDSSAKTVYNASVPELFATFCRKCVNSLATEGYCILDTPEIPVSWREFSKRIFVNKLLVHGASGFLETAFLGRPDTAGICVIPPYEVYSAGGPFSCDLSPGGGDGHICAPMIVGGSTNPVATGDGGLSNPKHYKQGLDCGKVDRNAPISDDVTWGGMVSNVETPSFAGTSKNWWENVVDDGDGTEPKKDNTKGSGDSTSNEKKGSSDKGSGIGIWKEFPSQGVRGTGGNGGSGGANLGAHVGHLPTASGGAGTGGTLGAGEKTGGRQGPAYGMEKWASQRPFTEASFWSIYSKENDKKYGESHPDHPVNPPMDILDKKYHIKADWSNIEDFYRNNMGGFNLDNPDLYGPNEVFDYTYYDKVKKENVVIAKLPLQKFTEGVVNADYIGTAVQMNLDKLKNGGGEEFIDALSKRTKATYSIEARKEAIEWAEALLQNWVHGVSIEFYDHKNGLTQEVYIYESDGSWRFIDASEPKVSDREKLWKGDYAMFLGYFSPIISLNKNGEEVRDGTITWDSNRLGSNHWVLFHESLHAISHLLASDRYVTNVGMVDHEIMFELGVDDYPAPEVDVEGSSTKTSKNFFAGFDDQGLSGSNGTKGSFNVNMGSGHKNCNPLTGACGGGGNSGGGGGGPDNPLYMPNPLSDGSGGGGSLCTSGQKNAGTFFDCANDNKNTGAGKKPGGPDPCPPDICGNTNNSGDSSAELICSIGSNPMKMSEGQKLWDPLPQGAVGQQKQTPSAMDQKFTRMLRKFQDDQKKR